MTTASNSRRFLAIVPARGGSKGIVRKNLRPLAGKPLLLHTLDMLATIDSIDRLVVSTEDAEIAGIARLHGYEVLERPETLAADATTLSEVALSVAEALDWEGDLGVFQPTAPLRTEESVVEALGAFRTSSADSMASAVRETHLFWIDEYDDLSKAQPLFTERVNRQYAKHRVLRETGSIQLVRLEALREGRDLVTANHVLFETPQDESLDIDTLADFAGAQHRLERGMVIFRIRANLRVGSGHLYHALAVAEELQVHDLVFLLKDCDPFVADVLDARGWRHTDESDLAEDLADLDSGLPTVLVNDILDTSASDVLPAVARGMRVVNIEDLGQGARHADWVVNALYPLDGSIGDGGPDYTTLRTEFMALPDKEIREDATRVLVTFGGTDPAGLSKRIGTRLHDSLEASVRIVLGPGAAETDFAPDLDVVRTVPTMAEEMLAADLVVTSAGRTVYEAAATGTPVVVVAQNAREATHSHLAFEDGVVFLGVGPLVDEDRVVGVVKRLLADVELRRELSTRLKTRVDGLGARRIAQRIDDMIAGLR